MQVTIKANANTCAQSGFGTGKAVYCGANPPNTWEVIDIAYGYVIITISKIGQDISDLTESAQCAPVVRFVHSICVQSN